MADTNKFNIINASRVLHKLWEKPGISRIEISEELNLDRSTITKITKQLLDEEWVSITQKNDAREQIGRRPEGLIINQKLGIILGVEVRPRCLQAAIINIQGELLYTEKVAYKPEETSVNKALYAFLDKVIMQAKESKQHILQIGIGIAGIIDPIKGIVHLSNPMYIRSPQPLAEELSNRYAIPVIVENDAHCCCWGELVYRKGKTKENFLTVLGEFRAANIVSPKEPGIAIGLGLVMGGEVFYGDHYRTGEFQSVDWQPGSITQFSLSEKKSYNLSDNKKRLNNVFKELAKNLSLLINICDINNVILAGDIVNHIDQLTPILNEAVNFNWLYKHVDTRKVSVQSFPLGENAVSFGAASCALMRIFSIPNYKKQEGILRGTQLLKEINHK